MRIPRLFLQSCHLNNQFQAWTAAQSCSIPGPGLCTVLCWASWIFCLCTSPVGWDPFCVWPAHDPALVPIENLLGLILSHFLRSLMLMLNSITCYMEDTTIFLSGFCLNSSSSCQRRKKKKKQQRLQKLSISHMSSTRWNLLWQQRTQVRKFDLFSWVKQ